MLETRHAGRALHQFNQFTGVPLTPRIPFRRRGGPRMGSSAKATPCTDVLSATKTKASELKFGSTSQILRPVNRTTVDCSRSQPDRAKTASRAGLRDLRRVLPTLHDATTERLLGGRRRPRSHAQAARDFLSRSRRLIRFSLGTHRRHASVRVPSSSRPRRD